MFRIAEPMDPANDGPTSVKAPLHLSRLAASSAALVSDPRTVAANQQEVG